MKLIKSRRFSPLLLTLLFLGTLVTFATGGVQARGHTGARTGAPVKTASTHILVTPKGRTLYVFALDSKDKSACTGACAKFWPPSLVKSAHPRTSIAGIPGTFGAITRSDGTHQLTYDGAPLYTFLEDKKSGDMNGQGVVASGGYWWAVAVGRK